MLVFVEKGKPEKNLWSKARTNGKLNTYTSRGRNRTQATLQGGERSRQCAIHAPQHCRTAHKIYHLGIYLAATLEVCFNTGSTTFMSKQVL